MESRSRSPAHQGSYVREVLAGLFVSNFLEPLRNFPYLEPDFTIDTVIERFDAANYPVLPVLDAENRLQGIVVLEEVHLAAQSENVRPWLLAVDLMRPLERPLLPEDRLIEAMELFVEYDLLAIPVVENVKQAKSSAGSTV